MVTSVSPADSGWVNSTITHSSESICAGPNARSDCVHRVPSERLEVKPEGNDERNVLSPEENVISKI